MTEELLNDTLKLKNQPFRNHFPFNCPTFVNEPPKPQIMKKTFRTLSCISSIIAAALMLIGIILRLVHSNILDISPRVWYFSAINFIAFAILFHLAGKPEESR